MNFVPVADSVVDPRVWPWILPGPIEPTQILCFRPEDRHRYSSSMYDLRAFGSASQDFSQTPKGPRKTGGGADDLEDRLGVTMASLLQSDRHRGRGWHYLGTGHPRSVMTQSVTLAQSIDFLLQLANEIEVYLNQIGPTIFVLTGVASLETKILCLLARRNGHRVRVLAPLRYGNVYYWAKDEFLTPSASRVVNDVEVLAGLVSGPPERTRNLLALERKRVRLSSAIKVSSHHVVRGLYGHLAELSGRRTKRPNRYLVRDLAVLPFRKWVQFREYAALSSRDWSPKMGNYIYLPLQVEPEASMNILSPNFDSQLGLIQMVSKALPCRYNLVVKEHLPALGRRPSWLYRELAGIPNLILASLDLNGADLARASSMTVTISGSAGIEAALAGVPVLLFGSRSYYGALSNCQEISCVDELSRLIREVPNRNRLPEALVAAEYAEICSTIAGGIFSLGRLSLDDLSSPTAAVSGVCGAMRSCLERSVVDGLD